MLAAQMSKKLGQNMTLVKLLFSVNMETNIGGWQTNVEVREDIIKNSLANNKCFL